MTSFAPALTSDAEVVAGSGGASSSDSSEEDECCCWSSSGSPSSTWNRSPAGAVGDVLSAVNCKLPCCSSDNSISFPPGHHPQAICRSCTRAERRAGEEDREDGGEDERAVSGRTSSRRSAALLAATCCALWREGGASDRPRIHSWHVPSICRSLSRTSEPDKIRPLAAVRRKSVHPGMLSRIRCGAT